MKRSECIRFLEKCLDQIDPDWDAFSTEQIAKLILDELELNHGMCPPAVKEPCETFVLYNGQYIKTEDSFTFVHKWDEE